MSNPVLVLIVFALLGIMGLFTFRSVQVNLMPDVTFPYLIVSAAYTNAGPQSVENAVTKVIEDGLVSINNLKKMTSISSEGFCTVGLEFFYGTNLDAATNEVRDALDGIKDYLPKSVKTPGIMKMNMGSMPILNIAVRGNRSEDELRYIAMNNIKKVLAQAGGVAQAVVNGGRSSIVRVELSRNRLAAYGLSVSDIASTLALENLDLGGGRITENNRNFVIRTTGEYKSIEEINNTVIKTVNGYNVRLSDVGKAGMGHSDISQEVFINGMPGIYISVIKRSGTNSVKVADGVYAKLAEIQKTLPSDIHLEIISDDTTMIRDTLRTLFESAWQGILLAVLVLFVFLKSFKSTFIISISIPFSIIITMLVMHMTGITLNIMTLTGLILGVGMVVDASIVMIDNIYVYRMRGAKPRVAAELGTQEMIASVISGNLTTIVVFVPFLLYMKELGYVGQLFRDMIFTIVIAIVSSLFVAVFLIPVLAGHYLPLTNRMEKPVRNQLLKKLYAFFDRIFDLITAGYRRVLTAALTHKKRTVCISIGILFCSVALIPLLHVKAMPDTESESVTLKVSLPVGTPIEKTTAVIRKFESYVLQDVKGYTNVIVSAGVDENEEAGSVSYKGSLSVFLPSSKKQIDTSSSIQKKLSAHFGEFSGVQFTFQNSDSDSMAGADLDIVIRSNDFAAGSAAAKQVKAAMSACKDVGNIAVDMEEGLPQVEINIDRRRAALFGISIDAAAREVSNCIAGVTATRYRTNGKEYNVVLIYKDSDKNQVIDLDAVRVRGTNGMVRLSNFATLKRGVGPVAVRHENRIRTIHITGSILTKKNANIVENIVKKNLAASYIIPSGVTVSYEGSWKTMAKQGNVFLQIVILAILLVFGVMAGTYGSFKAPFINMMTIPFMLTGVSISYVLMRQPVSIMTMVGLVMLVGIVVNNGIILVDYTNLLINRGYKMKDACLAAGTSRLRPVLMTTLTTILGMLPMSFTTAGSAALVQPIGLCVVGGLTSSTFVTLFFIPVLYSLVMKEKKTERSSIAVDGTGSGKELNVANNEKMAYRCEIIANQSVEDDLLGLLEEQVSGIQYTLNEGIYGRGTRNRKLGTAIWPELNFALYTYVRSEFLESVQQVVDAVQKKFPDEGIQLFVLPVSM
jgi:hydrophobic/amphiphilic exporter-1 (mainly G- bacteria), HAE1 family